MIRLALATAAAVIPLPSHATLVADRAAFGRLAEQGLAQTRTGWWNTQAGWFSGRSSGDPPIASLWSSYPAMELVAAVGIADPTPANKQAVDTLFKQGESFWDPTLENGAGGVSWLWGLKNSYNGFFDDAGWWGVSYLDAYRATGKARWLWDAARALSYIDRFGWDPVAGGMWWDGGHDHKTSEPLAAATLIAATLYRIQHKAYYLNLAKKYIGWADAKTTVNGLYGRSATDGTVMDYVEGMMVAAHVELCRGTKQRSWCTRAEALAQASLKAFPLLADWAPETDVVYLRWLLDLYEQDHDPNWYAVVYTNAKRAAANARDDQGFWSLRWDGTWTLPQTLATQAATLELFAWMAATPPP